MKKIWFDITNTPHVHFQLALYRGLKKDAYTFEFTAREFSETTRLLKAHLGSSFKILGGHHGKNYFGKITGLAIRAMSVYQQSPEFDVSISNGSESAIWTSWLKRKRAIAFGDNDQARQWTYSRFVDYCFFPSAINKTILINQGIKKNKLYQYNGYKEDIYIADYQPDQQFLSELPFNNYVLVRPENIQANYIRNGNVRSIAPELLRLLTGKGYNVLYLPRYAFDRNYAEGLKNVHIPSAPVNGLDACYFADAVLTGAGTFAREAACLGVPAVSFYAGRELLMVDQSMIEKGWTFFSRNPEEIVNHLPQTRRRAIGIERCKAVKSEVLNKLKNVINAI
ncbi:MAG: DUF354 domain-containing protein [Desulfobacterium sp.]|nr:DUF354 domain-containing protein [Desulfobacterium sp.]